MSGRPGRGYRCGRRLGSGDLNGRSCGLNGTGLPHR